MTATPRTGPADVGALIVYGAGGHGLVVAEAAAAAGWTVLGFADDAATVPTVGPWRVLRGDEAQRGDAAMIVAIGDNFARRRIHTDLQGIGRPLATVVHPHAWVSPSASVGRGVFIGAGAVVNAEAQLSDGVIVNTGAVVEHHCRVGEFVHVAPGAKLAGGVSVGGMSLIGMGACVLPKLSVGQDCTVAAGAVVLRDVPDRAKVMGVPARG